MPKVKNTFDSNENLTQIERDLIMEKQRTIKLPFIFSSIIIAAGAVITSTFLRWEWGRSGIYGYVSRNAWDLSFMPPFILIICALLTIVFAVKQKRWSAAFMVIPAFLATGYIISDKLSILDSPGTYLCSLASVTVLVIGIIDLIKLVEWTPKKRKRTLYILVGTIVFIVSIITIRNFITQKSYIWTALHSSDPSRRSKAVIKIKSQKVLASIAKNDRDEWVRLNTIDHINDENLIADLAKDDYSSRVRASAVANLDTAKWQELFAGIVKKDRSSDVRVEAVEKLNAVKWQSLLADVAENDEDDHVKETAVKKVNDQNLLTQIVKNNDTRSIYENALKKISDQNLLRDIVVNGEYSESRAAALEKLDTDEGQQLLIDIVKSECKPYEGELEGWTVVGSDPHVLCKTAISKLNDTKVLTDLAKNNKSEEIQKSAKKRLSELTE